MQQETLLQQVLEYNGTPGHQLIRAWMESEIDRLRRLNDNAKGDDVIENQGAIRQLKMMVKRLDPPQKPERDVTRDGAYT